MKVLIIPEDQTLDQYVAKPVVEALLADLGLTARVTVLPEPRLQGSGDALDQKLIREIVRDNAMIDLFLLIADRDCDRENNTSRAAARQEEHEGKLICCLAVEEIEVWLMALHKDRLRNVRFSDVRAECDPKERYAQPLLDELGSSGPGGGRKRAMRALSGQWRSLRDSCPELRQLQHDIQDWRERQPS